MGKGLKGSKNPMYGMSEEKSPVWKGDKIGYSGVHYWVIKWKGRPKKCEVCGTTKAKRFEWANIDHKYRRVLEDYIRVCPPCHRTHDWRNNNYKGGNKNRDKTGRFIKK